MAFVLRSNSFADQDKLPKDFVHHAMGAGGDNVSPELSWAGAPEGTQSFALTMYDPDAPTGSGWWHWVVYDIPASVTSLTRGAGAAADPRRTVPALSPDHAPLEGGAEPGTGLAARPCGWRAMKPEGWR